MMNITEAVALKMIQYFGKDVRRINHALKVHSFAKIIAGLETLAEENVIILDVASLLHDIGIKEAERRYQSSAGHYQELLGPEIARNLIEDLNLPEPKISRIGHLIGNHHSYGKIDGLDFQILVEADFLVNIFEEPMNREQIGVIREKYFKTQTGIEILTKMYPSS